MIGYQTVTNATTISQQQQLNGSQTFTNSLGWTASTSVNVSVSGDVSIPLVANGKITTGESVTFTLNGSTSVAQAESWQVQCTAPPQSIVVATTTVNESTATVPFTLAGNFVYSSGATVSGSISGTYSGINEWGEATSFAQFNLNGSPAAHPAHQPAATLWTTVS